MLYMYTHLQQEVVATLVGQTAPNVNYSKVAAQINVNKRSLPDAFKNRLYLSSWLYV